MDPVGGQRKWASVGLLTRSSLVEQCRWVEFDSVLDFRVNQTVIISQLTDE